MLYLVKYSGAFGFIKPWTAVRDSETFSQQFLTPSIIEGMEKKLFPELLNSSGLQGKILRHRLTYSGISRQQEQTQPRAIHISSPKKSKVDKNISTVTISRSRSILTRGVMLDPILWLGFAEYKFAKRAAEQHICLCRNEDVLLPHYEIISVSEEKFDTATIDNISTENFNGYELRFGQNDNSFLVGFNRFQNAEPMHGWLHVVGNPIHTLTP
jgi:hypothetical protein